MEAVKAVECQSGLALAKVATLNDERYLSWRLTILVLYMLFLRLPAGLTFQNQKWQESSRALRAVPVDQTAAWSQVG